MHTHFIEVRDCRGPSRSPHPSAQYLTAAAFLAAVHAENTNWQSEGVGNVIAVAFPGLLTGDPFPLGISRAFGSGEQIRCLGSRLRQVPALSKGVVVDEVNEVSERQSAVRAAFIRARRPERETVAFHDRELRRAQRKVAARIARGETDIRPPLSSDEREIDRLGAIKEGQEIIRASVTMLSSSTKQAFRLFVSPVGGINGGPDGEVDSYGLSRRTTLVGVPHF